MTTENGINITFRKKFENLVNAENRAVFMAAVETFSKLNPFKARQLLWRLTYSREFLEQNLQTLGLDLEIVPSDDMVFTLRNELRYQYELQHPDFLAVKVPDECLEAFTDLENHTDAVTAYVVHENCLKCSYFDKTSVNRLLKLLESEKENCYFRGLRDIGFSYEASQYLKPFHEQIHDLLMALYNHNHQHQQPFTNTPFEDLAQQLGNDWWHIPDDVLPFTLGENPPQAKTPDQVGAPDKNHTEQSVQPNPEPAPKFKPLTSESVLEHEDVFSSFVEGDDMNVLVKIANLGFDLNKVMAKKELIKQLLEENALVKVATAKLHMVAMALCEE